LGAYDRGLRAFLVAPIAIVVALLVGAGTLGGVILFVVAGTHAGHGGHGVLPDLHPGRNHHLPARDASLGASTVPAESAPIRDTSRAQELVAVGASIGANSHPLLRLHVTAALDVGLSPAEVKAAAKMATYVHDRAVEITAEEATDALDEAGAIVGAVSAGS
jgi:hypothetical protein